MYISQEIRTFNDRNGNPRRAIMVYQRVDAAHGSYMKCVQIFDDPFAYQHDHKEWLHTQGIKYALELEQIYVQPAEFKRLLGVQSR